MTEQHEILTERKNKTGFITLNRPKSLNALNLAMIQKITQVLNEWQKDKTVELVILQSNNEKSFCAGGDIRAVYEAGKENNKELGFQFFYQEYILNQKISRYPKPILSLIDGIVMGGGAGLAMNGQYRVVTERTIFAMPETVIGFFPDVGAGYFLNKCPGMIGLYLALTGERINHSDCLYSHLATHVIPASKLAELKSDLISAGQPIAEILKKFSGALSSPSHLAACQPVIDRYFSRLSLDSIIDLLQSDGQEWSKKTADNLLKRSPLSLRITFEYMQKCAKLTFEEVMQLNLRLSQFFMGQKDFYEGVRAVLVDKDQQPKWQAGKISPEIIHHAMNFPVKQLLPFK
jgi:enoyl-CoA hydratase/carnithine racemase